MKKLKIENLKLKSFVTDMPGKVSVRARGGALRANSDIRNCSALDACETALQCG
ncbi:pinensin family lanthipeptide [Roseivirga sp. BDSF3-8]|uniref:pinensin family lanthipeptide n=1 Tax=Roseivirga sp. BDSF3-8 TaxID=3241598 RepID=UPI00353215DD